MLFRMTMGAVLLFAGWGAFRPDRALDVATGYVSHSLCSGAFVSGLDPAQIYKEQLMPIEGIRLLNWAIRYKVDGERHEVITTVAGMYASRAVYHDGFGCTVVRGDEPAFLKTAFVADRAWPESEPAIVDTRDPQLKAALDHAFVEPAHGPPRQTKAVVVLHVGHIVAERYAAGYGIHTQVHGWSEAKSFLNALLGVLVREGLLSMTQPAPVTAWQSQGDPRRAITLDQLLRMQSGLALGNSLTSSSPWDREARMMFVERDMAGFAESAGLRDAPGTRWNYANGNTEILSRIVRDAVGGHADDVLRFAHHEILDPLGMHHVTLEFDATGDFIAGSHMFASARDWARLGQLYLQDGIVDGRRILPERWVQYSATATPGAWVGYGAGFWTNRSTVELAQKRIAWGMPSDAFYMCGRFGQFVVIVPSEQLVVARFGESFGRYQDMDGTSRLVKEVIVALHAHGNEASPTSSPAN